MIAHQINPGMIRMNPSSVPPTNNNSILSNASHIYPPTASAPSEVECRYDIGEGSVSVHRSPFDTAATMYDTSAISATGSNYRMGVTNVMTNTDSYSTARYIPIPLNIPDFVNRKDINYLREIHDAIIKMSEDVPLFVEKTVKNLETEYLLEMRWEDEFWEVDQMKLHSTILPLNIRTMLRGAKSFKFYVPKSSNYEVEFEETKHDQDPFFKILKTACCAENDEEDQQLQNIVRDHSDLSLCQQMILFNLFKEKRREKYKNKQKYKKTPVGTLVNTKTTCANINHSKYF
jgi:hypothetical protein